ncbi:uncharacterized protein LOC111107263 [Crassostrea virginica]
MDPDYSAQDVDRCDLCKTTIAQSYCDFCHVNLCKPCIGEHISDEYDKHKIVPIDLRGSTLIYPKCEKHQNGDCKYQCNDCNVFVCFHCTASKQHKAHEFFNIEELFNSHKEHAQKDAYELESQILPKYEEIVMELKDQISNVDDKYEKLTKEVSKHKDNLHRDLDIVFGLFEEELKEIKVKHLSILEKHLSEIKQDQSHIEQNLSSLSELTESNNVYHTLQYSSKNIEFRKLPPKVNVIMPKLIKKEKDRDMLRSLVGEFSPLSTAEVVRVFKARKPSALLKDLLDGPEILNTIKTGPEYLRSVTCLNEEEIWTSGETCNIKCFNVQGVLQKTIKTISGKPPYDIALDRNGTMIYSEGTTRTVYKVKNDQTEEIIRLQGWNPTQLCATSSGDLLVTMYIDDQTQSKVVRYSGSTVKQTIQFDEEGQPLYSGNSKIKYISENRNLDICVADSGAGAIVVVDQVGKLRFRYTGPFSSTRKKLFSPRGITTDSQSRILTSDYHNHCIRILDQDGLFLRYFDISGLRDLFGLCVDNNDRLFVCENHSRTVKEIKYLK